MGASDWIAIIAIVVVVVAAIGGFGWRLSYLLGSLNTRVATLSGAIEDLTKQVAEDREERRRIWERLDALSTRLAAVEVKQDTE